MCFSPQVSFAVSGILAAVGTAAVYKTKNRQQKLFSSIPLFFAIQQFAEGILWLALMGKASPTLIPYATYAYLFFAQTFWPTWIPISILSIEKEKMRKKLLIGALLLGAFVSVSLMYYLIKFGAISSTEGNHIFYQTQTPINYIVSLILYVTSVTLPFFISSNTFMLPFGLLVLGSLVISYIFYYHWLTSIWCFFAAVLSFLIYIAVVKKKI